MDSIYAEMTPRAMDKRAADIAAAVAAGQGGQGAALTAPVPGKQLVWSKLPELPNPTQQYCMTRWVKSRRWSQLSHGSALLPHWLPVQRRNAKLATSLAGSRCS